MVYRTKTYIAAAWEEDSDAVEQLLTWNDSDRFSLEFKNIHDYKQARDESLPCSIKKSLSERMDYCKVFILIVGPYTTSVKKGYCMYCPAYKAFGEDCSIGTFKKNKSFIEFECDKARREYQNGHMKILVLYNASMEMKEWCPESLRDIGVHVPMKSHGVWDYMKVRTAFLLL